MYLTSCSAALSVVVKLTFLPFVDVCKTERALILLEAPNAEAVKWPNMEKKRDGENGKPPMFVLALSKGRVF